MKINIEKINNRLNFLDQIKRNLKSDSLNEAYKFAEKLVDDILNILSSKNNLILPDKNDLKNKMVNETIYYYSTNMSPLESLIRIQTEAVKNNVKKDEEKAEVDANKVLESTKIDSEKNNFKHIYEYHINRSIDQAITYINFKNNCNDDFRFVETRLEELVRNSINNCFKENKKNMENLYNHYLEIIIIRNSYFNNLLKEESADFEYFNAQYSRTIKNSK